MMDRTGENPKLNCKSESGSSHWNAGARLTKYWFDWECDDTKMMKMIAAYGSATTVIYSGDDGFLHHKGGEVFDTCSDQEVNHAVQAIGWGTQNGIPYWLIKNSWGKSFGDGGYIRVKRGTCGIASRCAAAAAEKYGYVEDVPEKTGYLAAEACDVKKSFGEIHGKTQIYFYFPDGRKVHSNVNCSHGKCTMRDPHEGTSSCMAMCGRETCPRDSLKPSYGK